MSEAIRLAYSPCPNDTYAFSAIARGELRLPGRRFDIRLMDIEQLNRAAESQLHDISKLSLPVFLRQREHYRLLDVGAALGFDCGPLLLSTCHRSLQGLQDCRIVFPGERTTAYLLFRMLGLRTGPHLFAPYDRIVPMLQAGEADCGVIIHESRFTYAAAGLHCLLDLGAWWHAETGLPLPLGCLVMHRRIDGALRRPFEALLRQSIQRARTRAASADDYVRRHAQELQPDVIDRHVELYVNDHTISLGRPGMRAIAELASRADALGLAA